MGKIKKDDKLVNFRDPLLFWGLIVDQLLLYSAIWPVLSTIYIDMYT